MPRASFDRSFSAWTNDGTYSPDTLKFESVGRLVPQSHALFRSPPWNEATAYLTWNGSSLSAGGFAPVAGGYDIDTSSADIVVFPDDGSGWLVLRVETITPLFGPPYRRAWLANIF